MIEYKLDRPQDEKTPYDVVHELSGQYKDKYDRLIEKEQIKNKKLKKELYRCRGYRAFLFFRRLIYLVFVLLFLTTSLLYSGFATNRYVGFGILGLIAISLMASLAFFLLAIFRQMYFRTALLLARIMLVTCAAIISLTSFILFGIISYFIVFLALVIVNILNHAYASTRYSAKSQVLPTLISLASIILAILCMIGVIREEAGSILHERELYSRFAKYEITEAQSEKSATFDGIMLTVNDLLPIGDKGIYQVADAVNDEIKVIAVGARAFNDVSSVKTVVLPDSVTQINAGAFDGSAVQTINVLASEIYIADGFEGSTVRIVRLLNNKATKIVIGDGLSVSENITFFVPEELVWECRTINPELVDNIVPMQE